MCLFGHAQKELNSIQTKSWVDIPLETIIRLIPFDHGWNAVLIRHRYASLIFLFLNDSLFAIKDYMDAFHVYLICRIFALNYVSSFFLTF